MAQCNSSRPFSTLSLWRIFRRAKRLCAQTGFSEEISETQLPVSVRYEGE